MHKKLSLILIASIIFTQAFALAHLAGFGFKEHAHHGQPCQISFLYKHIGHALTPVVPAVPIFVIFSFFVAVVGVLFCVGRSCALPQPRSPPLFVL